MTQGAQQAVAATGQVLCRLADLVDGAAAGAEGMVDGVPENLIVVREGATAHVYLNVCPHAGRRLDWAPGKFLLKDGIMVCAVHGASFQANSGHCVGGPCKGDHLREIAAHVNAAGEVVLD